jgi:hypothetical protein
MGMVGAAVEDAQHDGLIPLDLWSEGSNGCPVWQETNPVQSNHNTTPTMVHRGLLRLYHSQVLPFIEMIHKRVEVWMEDTSVAPPYNKYADLRREILALLVEIPKDDLQHGKDMFAFDAIVPVCSGIHVGGVTVTFQSDCTYSASLSKKIRKLPPAWWFWYLCLVQGYNLSMVQSSMESFDTQHALLSKFSSFDLVTLEVECEFGDVDDQLEGI